MIALKNKKRSGTIDLADLFVMIFLFRSVAGSSVSDHRGGSDVGQRKSRIE